MADSKISDLASLTGANGATGDLFELVDISDTSLAATGTNKKTTYDDIATFVKGRHSIDTIASGSLPAAATQDFTSISAKYSCLLLTLAGVSSNTATRHPRVQLDSDNGASFDTSATNYPAMTFDVATGTGTGSNEASLCPRILDATAATTWNIDIYISGYNGGAHPFFAFTSAPGGTPSIMGFGHFVGTTAAINAIRVLWSGSGNFDAGTYALYGMY